MALVVDDRVQETTNTTGTGTVTLLGAVVGFQSFSVIGNGNTTYYTIVGGAEWEVGLGTYTSSGTTLARTTVLESSNSGSLVNFSVGTKNVFVTYPSSQAVMLTATQTLTNKTLTSPSISGAVMSTMASSVITSGTLVNSTSGTAIDFTGIPSWAKRITLMFSTVSISGTDSIIVRLGTSGGVETTGYLSTGVGLSNVAFTTGFGFLTTSIAANSYSGQMVISLMTPSTNTWTYTSILTSGSTTLQYGGGAKSLAGTLDRLRVMPDGANTFDLGRMNILYE